MPTLAIIAASNGGLIFLAVVVVLLLAIVFGYYTRRGSGINQRPSDGRGGSPGAKGSSVISTAEDRSGRTVGSRGTR